MKREIFEAILRDAGYSESEASFVGKWIVDYGLSSDAKRLVLEVFKKAKRGVINVSGIVEVFQRYCHCWLTPGNTGDIRCPNFGDANRIVFYMVHRDLYLEVPEEFEVPEEIEQEVRILKPVYP